MIADDSTTKIAQEDPGTADVRQLLAAHLRFARRASLETRNGDVFAPATMRHYAQKAALTAVAMAAVLAALLGACGDGNGDRDRDRDRDRDGGGGRATERPTNSTVTGVTERVPISFRPVLEQSGPDRCADATTDALPSHDRSTCYVLADGITVTRYAAARGVSGGPVDAPVVDITIVDDDLEAFNRLAAQCFARGASCRTGALAIVYDGVVMSAPTVHEPSFSGAISITGEREAIEALLDDLSLS